MHKAFFRLCGVDLTRLEGIHVTTALVVLGEIGTDMSRFPSDKHFAFWLGLCPVHQAHRRQIDEQLDQRCANPAAQAFRWLLLRCTTASLGAYFRRLCARIKKPRR